MLLYTFFITKNKFILTDFKWELYNWRETAEYSTEMKQFACTLYLCSSKVYDYVRKILKLPHSSILRT